MEKSIFPSKIFTWENRFFHWKFDFFSDFFSSFFSKWFFSMMKNYFSIGFSLKSISWSRSIVWKRFRQCKGTKTRLKYDHFKNDGKKVQNNTFCPFYRSADQKQWVADSVNYSCGTLFLMTFSFHRNCSIPFIKGSDKLTRNVSQSHNVIINPHVYPAAQPRNFYETLVPTLPPP